MSLKEEEKTLNETVVWKTFSLTYIEYPEDDVWGKYLAILSLTPLIIVIMFLTFFAAKRDMHTLTFGIGTILNGCINVFLKHTFKESRPEESLNRAKTSKLWEQYGWPSSHSQFMFFVSSYLVLFVLFRLNHAGASLKNRFYWLLTLLAGMALAAIVAYGRVYLGYHSQNQVYWGGGIGAGGGYGGIGTKLVDVIGRVILVIVVRPNSICARVLLLASSFALAITASRLTVPIVVCSTVQSVRSCLPVQIFALKSTWSVMTTSTGLTAVRN